MSIFFPLLALALSFRLGEPAVGLSFAMILFISVVAHEFGHVLAARITGGDGDEILLTPLGGLAFCYPAQTFQSRFWTVAGGPLVNIGLCLISLIQVLNSTHVAACINPFEFPPVQLSGGASSVVPVLGLMLFKANWLLLLINLVPVHPLDGGRMLQLVLNTRFEAAVSRMWYLRAGGAVGILMLLSGLMMDNTWLMAAGALILPLNLSESFQMNSEDRSEESFMGYDFSQGYTSLEQSLSDDPEAEQRPGVLSRWRAQREEERQLKQQQEDRDMEHQLDQLLEKLHTHGDSALTPAEKRRLQDISERLRQRGRSS
ncbi:MAG: hypothetical protein O3B13_20650 [Planctomycetota bacterium]|nr:hypothetical protein [Planctomycetota bacterium]MDA1165514.1 hypothetical protein [Planctomycetota bacterium]